MIKRIPFKISVAKDIQDKKIEGKIVTRQGNDVRIICWDAKGCPPIVALVTEKDKEYLFSYYENGNLFTKYNSNYDLFIETTNRIQMYTTIYALTRGIIKVEVKIDVCNDGSKLYFIPNRSGSLLLGEELFYTYNEAAKKAEELRLKEIKKLENKLQFLKELNFNI